MMIRSQDQRVRFFETDPEKFGLSAGTYTRSILGLDLAYHEDWFKGYFVDLLAATRTETLDDLRLRKIEIESSFLDSKKVFKAPKHPETFLEKMKDFFWIL